MATIEVKAAELSEITPDSISGLIAQGKNHLAMVSPDDLYHIKIPPGLFDWSLLTTPPRGQILTVNDVVSSPIGGLRISGEGYDQTTIVWPQDYGWFRLTECHGLVFSGMKWTCPRIKVTQGYVLANIYPYVIFELEPGFPTPLQLMDIREEFQNESQDDRWMNAITDEERPVIIDAPWNGQRPWDDPVCIGKGVLDNTATIWAVRYGKKPKMGAPYAIGMSLGLTGKNSGGPGLIGGGSRVGFEEIHWEHGSRIKWFGTDQPIYCGNVVKLFKPDGARRYAVFSTAGGGPQFDSVTNPIVRDNVLVGPGDDPMAFFNVNVGQIENNYIDVARKRSTFMFNSRGLKLVNHMLVNGKILYRDGPDENGKMHDEFVDPPPAE